MNSYNTILLYRAVKCNVLRCFVVPEILLNKNISLCVTKFDLGIVKTSGDQMSGHGCSGSKSRRYAGTMPCRLLSVRRSSWDMIFLSMGGKWSSLWLNSSIVVLACVSDQTNNYTLTFWNLLIFFLAIPHNVECITLSNVSHVYLYWIHTLLVCLASNRWQSLTLYMSSRDRKYDWTI